MLLSMIGLADEARRLNGLSERLLQSHHENNYGGALRRLNALDQELAALDWAKAPGYLINGLKREALMAHNSVVLHEIYFDGLGVPGRPEDALLTDITRSFGSLGGWRDQFAAMGKALGGGSGWVLLAYSSREDRLVNQWAADHSCAMPDATPLLALDMYEHAYHIDFGANAASYVDAFLENIDWRRVAARHALAVGGRPQAVAVADVMKAGRTAAAGIVLDVRRAAALARDPVSIPGARHHAPDDVGIWGRQLRPGSPILVYCVHGHQVGQGVAARLNQMGHDAKYLSGGLEGWKAAGGPVVPAEVTP